MKRTQIYLEEEQDRRLSERATVSGATKSALIREAIEEYLNGPDDEAKAIARFKAALKKAAGTAPYLPSGRVYVERLRAIDRRRYKELERRWRG